VGWPGAGQGLLVNTTTPDAPGSTPVCAPGFVSCSGRCDVSCTNPLRCPAATPWRCPDGSCRPTPAGPCTPSAIYGYLDDLSQARFRYYYEAPGVVPPDTPLVFYSFSGQGQLQYLNGTAIAVSAGPDLVFGVVQRTYPELTDWVDTGWKVYWQANPDPVGDITIYPAPPVVPAGPIKLSSPYGQVVCDFIGTTNTFLPFSNASATPAAVLVQFPPYGYALQGGGNASTLQACLTDLPACVWNWTGTSIGPFCSSAEACGLLPSVVVLQQDMIVRQRTYLNDYVGLVWDLWVYAPPAAYPVVLVGNLSEVELVTTGNLSMACACPVLAGFGGVNQSALNAQYLADPTRTTPTDFAVVPYTLQGDYVPVRAQVAEVVLQGAIVSAPGWPDFYVPPSGLHYLSPAEFQGGIPTCDARVFPVRCQPGTCASVQAVNTTVAASCDCQGSFAAGWQCTCSLGIACTCDTDSCTCPGAPLQFAADLAAEIAALANCQCLFDPDVPHPLVTYGTAVNGSWLFAPQNSSLLEIDVPGGCFPLANTTLANFTLYCEPNATVLVPGPYALSDAPFQVRLAAGGG
jgi:hypothetical protein